MNFLHTNFFSRIPSAEIDTRSGRASLGNCSDKSESGWKGRSLKWRWWRWRGLSESWRNSLYRRIRWGRNRGNNICIKGGNLFSGIIEYMRREWTWGIWRCIWGRSLDRGYFDPQLLWFNLDFRKYSLSCDASGRICIEHCVDEWDKLFRISDNVWWVCDGVIVWIVWQSKHAEIIESAPKCPDIHWIRIRLTGQLFRREIWFRTWNDRSLWILNGFYTLR